MHTVGKISGMSALFWALILVFSFSSAQNTPIKVEVVKNGDAWQLLRDGKPYYVKGAGGQSNLEKLVECGGNSIRTWSADNAEKVLDEAHALGLTVCLGIWVGHERHGFDYNDEWATAGQFAKFKETVIRLRNHPALLMWAIGNEMDLFYSNFKVWSAVQDIAKMIHEVDPNHPTMTVTAGIDVAEIQMIKEVCPDIDIMGINTYGDLAALPKKIRMYGWEKPYMVTEWGPNGHWEVEKTTWGTAREQTSAEKAAVYLKRYTKIIEPDKTLCIGSYVFLWGHKQETTASWYGLFLENGAPTHTIDVLQKVWSGKWPENRAPEVKGATINSQPHSENISLSPGKIYPVTLDANDPENKDLKIVWQVVPESTEKKAGGDFEKSIAEITGLVRNQAGLKSDLKAPMQAGAYRLYAYVYDDAGKAGTINVPFQVKR